MANSMSRMRKPVQVRRRKLILLWLLARIRARKLQLKKRRRWWVWPIFQNRVEQGDFYNLIHEMRFSDEDKHFDFFRMTRESFDILLEKVTPVLEKTSTKNARKPIPVGLKLGLTLRYLASGNSMVSVSYSERVGKSTISKIIPETCDAIWNVLSKEVLPNPSEEEWASIADDFFTRWNFPNCVGCIDGKHVVIQAPTLSGSNFYNYKNQHSLVLLAACDAQYCFTLVDIGASGRQSDGGIFANSEFGRAIVNGLFPLPQPLKIFSYTLPSVFTADAAFPLLPNLLRPYPTSTNDKNNLIFNYRLSRARRMIENTFGILAARWRIYRHPIIASLPTIETVIKATVVLHNWLQKASNEKRCAYCPPGMTDRENDDGTFTPGAWRAMQASGLVPINRTGTSTHSHNAKDIREEFKKYFVNEGELPWHWSRLYRS